MEKIYMLITTALLLLLRSEMGAAYCACATNTVNVWSGPNKQQPILYTLPAGECLIYRGDFAQGHGYTWLHLDYKGQSGWASSRWLNVKDCSEGGIW